MTANGNIPSTPILPVLFDPYITTGTGRPSFHAMPFWTYCYIHLCRSGKRTRPYQDHDQKHQLYYILFHMLVFKFDDWILQGFQGLIYQK